jgi:hypothetical protein
VSFDPERFEQRRRTFEDAGRATCPACGYPTIHERAGDVAGGPNHDYSLTEARTNFAINLTSYRPDDIDFESERTMTAIKRDIVKAYDRAVSGLIDVDQAEADAQYFFAKLYGM